MEKEIVWRVFCASYRVASANFLRRKLGHAHDNSADSENVAGVQTECAHAFHFSLRKRSGKLELLSIHDQNTAETSQPQAQPTDSLSLSISLSLWSSNNFRFAFLALQVASQAFTWNILICSEKLIMFFAARYGPRIEVLHRSCSWLNRKNSAFPSVGFVWQARKLELKVRLGLQSYSICGVYTEGVVSTQR